MAAKKSNFSPNTSFDFGANATKPKKPKAGGSNKGGKGSGGKSDAWRAYTGSK